MPYKVKLTYFKKSGKYYSEGEYITTLEHMHQIFEEVGKRIKSGRLPGLIEGVNDFHVLVEVPNHPYEYPALFVLED